MCNARPLLMHAHLKFIINIGRGCTTQTHTPILTVDTSLHTIDHQQPSIPDHRPLLTTNTNNNTHSLNNKQSTIRKSNQINSKDNPDIRSSRIFQAKEKPQSFTEPELDQGNRDPPTTPRAIGRLALVDYGTVFILSHHRNSLVKPLFYNPILSSNR